MTDESIVKTRTSWDSPARDLPQPADKDGWQRAPLAGSIRGGANSAAFKVGDWRSYRPVHIKENCIHCLLCWVFCPDMAIVAEDGKMVGFDYEHCKGCGICAEECPTKDKAIEMAKEEGQ